MDDRTTERAAAADRLFETALAEALTGEPTARLPEEYRADERKPASAREPAQTRAPRRALMGVLLGTVVVTCVWWSQHRAPQPVGAESPQEPLRPFARVRDGAALKTLRPDVGRLLIEEAVPADLALLSRFPHLHWVGMNAKFVGQGQLRWQRATPADLEPLTRCLSLRTLGLPYPMEVGPAHLKVLAAMPKLTSLHVSGLDALRLDRETVAALRRCPGLSELELTGVRFGAAEARALADWKELRSLQIDSGRGFDAAAMAAVGRISSLVRLHISGMARQPLGRNAGEQATWEPGPEDLAHLRGLKHLEALTLMGPEWTAERIRALPPQIERLSLASEQPFPPQGLRALRRFRELRRLAIGSLKGNAAEQAAAETAFIVAISGLPLRSLNWSRPASPAVMQAVAQLPLLEELSLVWMKETDFGPLRRHPRLSRLELADRGQSKLAHLVARLGVLRGCKKLSRVTIYTGGRSASERARLASALGEGVRVEVIQ